MSEEKPKYIRKKCEHNIIRRQCKIIEIIQLFYDDEYP